ncbi:hypothetical protein PIB30_024259 [Stylosanthes scabra]|uniref:Uncharacterized protein n=1 Tax=Stylosanthes scabra TaxID=79078 RepID=A0ABU6U8K2_9FABA|nr:hypothetical protein [Stylosanthes scabra]
MGADYDALSLGGKICCSIRYVVRGRRCFLVRSGHNQRQRLHSLAPTCCAVSGERRFHCCGSPRKQTSMVAAAYVEKLKVRTQISMAAAAIGETERLKAETTNFELSRCPLLLASSGKEDTSSTKDAWFHQPLLFPLRVLARFLAIPF